MQMLINNYWLDRYIQEEKRRNEELKKQNQRIVNHLDVLDNYLKARNNSNSKPKP